MKKIISIISVFILLLSFHGKAQQSNGSHVLYQDITIPSVKLVEGNNTIGVPNGKGTIKLTSRQTTIVVSLFTDTNGKTTALKAQGSGLINGETPVVFMSADKKIKVTVAKTTTTGYYRVYLGREAD